MTNDNTKAPEYDLSLVASAYQDAAETCDVATMDIIGDVIRAKGVEIAALTPADAQAARDARDKRVREETLREAAEEAGRIAERYLPAATSDYSAGFSDGADMAESAILALIEKENGDEKH